MTLGQPELVPSLEIAEARKTGMLPDRRGADLGVARTADAIEDHAGDAHPRVEAPKALYQGRRTAANAARVDHQQDGRVEQPCHISRAAGIIQRADAVEEPHHPLDHGQLGAGAGRPKQRAHLLRPEQPGIQVPADPSGGQRVIAGIDIVRATLEGLDAEAPRAARRSAPP